MGIGAHAGRSLERLQRLVEAENVAESQGHAQGTGARSSGLPTVRRGSPGRRFAENPQEIA